MARTWECWTLAGGSWTAGLVRNVYVLIDSDVPSLSVAFQNVLRPPGQQDSLMFDHLTVAATVAAVPELGELALLGVGLAALVARLRRQPARKSGR
jgi:hypothetical protein